MTIYALTRNNRRDPAGYQSTWAYRELFHGDYASKTDQYGKLPYVPMKLVRNTGIKPELFMPSIGLVVSDGLSLQLREASPGSFDLNPCVWHKVFDHSMEEADVRGLVNRFSRIFGPDSDDWPTPILRDPTPEESGLRYFEVVAPLLARVSPSHVCTVALKLPDQPVYHKKPAVMTCAALHVAFPLVKVTPYFLCTEPIYHILEPHIQNPHLFSVYEYSV